MTSWSSGARSTRPAAPALFAAIVPAIISSACVFLLPPKASAANEMEAVRRTGQAFVQVSRKVTPSVVNIRTFGTARSGPFELGDPFTRDLLEPFRDFFGRDFGERFYSPGDRRRTQLGLGSGVIVRSDGIVVTNNHVVAGADEILVTLADRTEVAADIVGSDPRTDIAVLRLPKGRYPPTDLGDSDALEVGEWVVAIGNPFGLGQSVTVGVVSAKGRANVGVADLEDFIQTDAAINPGNSGGPLINLDGAVVGINTAIFSRSGGYQGIGFAVPANMARMVMEGILRTGRVVRSDIGLRVQRADARLQEALGAKGTQGVVVSEVRSGGVAAKAGLRRGDLVTRVNGRPVPDEDSFYRAVSLLPLGEKVPLQVLRDGVPQTLMVEVGELPSRPQDSDVRLRAAPGFSVEELTEDLAEKLGYRYERGVLVTRVTRGSQADKAGIEPGDLITGVNGAAVPDLAAFRSRFEAVEWGDRVRLDILRRGKAVKVEIRLEEGR